MLETGQYPQWKSRFLRYINTRPNGDALRKCILSGLYKPTTVLVQAVVATESLTIPEHTTPEWSRFVTIVKQQHKLDEVSYHKLFDILKQYQKEVNVLPSEKDNDLEQAQRDKDMQKNLALIIKYFKKIYKPTNNNLRTSSNSRNKNVDMTPRTRMTINLDSLGIRGRKPKRVKDFAYHKEKMLLCKQAEQGVPLQAEQYDWLADMDEEIDEQELEAHYSYMAKIQEVLQLTQAPILSYWNRFVTIVKQQHKLDEVSYHKLFDVLKQYQKEVNVLRAKSFSMNANPLALEQECGYDSTNNNDNQSGQFRNQRTVNVDGARENVGSLVVQQSGIQCFICKEFRHFAKECRKPKRVKDFAYHKEKMLLCKQAEQGVPLQAEQYDWLADMEEEIDEQELEAHYIYMAKIQEVLQLTQAPILSYWN
nr:hypothetical protein [Tanacetum cinerariifolium]